MTMTPGEDDDERLDAELRDHVERHVAHYVERGMNEAEARRRVRLELGGLEQAEEAILGAFVPSFVRGMDLTVRTSTRAEPLIPAVRRELRAVDPSLPIARVATVDGRLSERLDARRFESQALAAFSGMALLLSATGLYASLAHQVALRRREIGVRTALGATRSYTGTAAFVLAVALAAAALPAFRASRLDPMRILREN